MEINIICEMENFGVIKSNVTNLKEFCKFLLKIDEYENYMHNSFINLSISKNFNQLYLEILKEHFEFDKIEIF